MTPLDFCILDGMTRQTGCTCAQLQVCMVLWALGGFRSTAMCIGIRSCNAGSNNWALRSELLH